MIHTKYSHMTDNELVRVAFIEAKSDMERELMKRLARAINEIAERELMARLARAINEIAEREEMVEQLELELEEVPLQ